MQVRHIDHVQLALPAGRGDEARAFYQNLRGLSGLRPETVVAQEFVTWLRDRGGRRRAGSGAVTALGRSTGYG
jgi:4-hydroxyphenylpyruvate dioxygenase-like putative hemolysin